MPPKRSKSVSQSIGGGFAGTFLAFVIIGLAWAVLTPIAVEQPWQALPPLVGIILLSVVGLILLYRFPSKRWRILGGAIFLIACADLYLVNAWWQVIPTVWTGGMIDMESARPLMVNCVLIGFIGAGAMLFLQLRPENGANGKDAEKRRHPV
jgi:divalent metal cation (Fe/Co/Zn/Cd) transporter